MLRKRGLGGGGGEPSAWVISVIWCCRHLLAAALQKLAPVKALAIDVDESRCGRSHRHCKRSVRLSGQRAIGQDCVDFASVLNEYLSGLRDQTIVTRKAILPVMVIW